MDMCIQRGGEGKGPSHLTWELSDWIRPRKYHQLVSDASEKDADFRMGKCGTTFPKGNLSPNTHKYGVDLYPATQWIISLTQPLVFNHTNTVTTNASACFNSCTVYNTFVRADFSKSVKTATWGQVLQRVWYVHNPTLSLKTCSRRNFTPLEYKHSAMVFLEYMLTSVREN